MAFAIEISEVGEAEYPLLEKLRESTFSEFGHISRISIAQSLTHRQDLYVLIAHLEGNPLGFAAGYRQAPGMYYLNYLGVLGDYRRQGVGRQLIERQEGFARSCGYNQIQFNTFNHFGGMVRLALAKGYAPVGVAQHFGTRWDLAIRFDKLLTPEAQPALKSSAVPANLTGAEARIPADDLKQLRDALDGGFTLQGILHQPGLARPLVLLHKVQSPSV